MGQVALRFPTPVASDGKRGSLTYMGGNLTLLGAARKFPTPLASDSRIGPDAATADQWGPRLGAVVTMGQGGGSLNPLWVEWLMGFPPGWTDCDVSETPSSLKWLDPSAWQSFSGGGPIDA